jgi:uncharacterized protein YndB with AHSA1/START domain
MSQTVDLDVFYPYPLERVWQVLTDRRSLAAWMMENDFEPKLGHRFRFYDHPLPGLTTTIQCEVVELEEPTRLVYTWQDSPTAEPSLVVWTLTTVAGGTQLRLKHYQYSYATASTFNRPGAISQTYQQSGQFCSELSAYTSAWKFSSWRSSQNNSQFDHSSVTATLEISISSFTWDYLLNQQLPQVLAQNKPTPD